MNRKNIIPENDFYKSFSIIVKLYFDEMKENLILELLSEEDFKSLINCSFIDYKFIESMDDSEVNQYKKRIVQVIDRLIVSYDKELKVELDDYKHYVLDRIPLIVENYKKWVISNKIFASEGYDFMIEYSIQLNMFCFYLYFPPNPFNEFFVDKNAFHQIIEKFYISLKDRFSLYEKVYYKKRAEKLSNTIEILKEFSESKNEEDKGNKKQKISKKITEEVLLYFANYCENHREDTFNEIEESVREHFQYKFAETTLRNWLRNNSRYCDIVKGKSPAEIIDIVTVDIAEKWYKSFLKAKGR